MLYLGPRKIKFCSRFPSVQQANFFALRSSYGMPPPLSPEGVTKSGHFQSVRGLVRLADSLLVLGLIFGLISSLDAYEVASEKFGNQFCSSCYSHASPLHDSLQRRKVTLHVIPLLYFLICLVQNTMVDWEGTWGSLRGETVTNPAKVDHHYHILPLRPGRTWRKKVVQRSE